MSELTADFARHMRAAGLSANTIRDRTELLKRLNRDLPMGVEMATVEELEAWLARPGWSAQTRSTYWQHITQFFRWATDPTHPKLDFDPSASLPRPKVPTGVPRPIRDEDLARLLDVAVEPFLTFIKLAAFAGCRAGETATIRREHIDERQVRITGKGGKTRYVPTHTVVWETVRDRPPGQLAYQLTGAPAGPHYVACKTGQYFRSLGINAALHNCRHWFATNLLRDPEEGGGGANLRTVQELLGHASLKTTAVYTAVTDAQRANAVAALRAPAPAAR